MKKILTRRTKNVKKNLIRMLALALACAMVLPLAPFGVRAAIEYTFTQKNLTNSAAMSGEYFVLVDGTYKPVTVEGEPTRYQGEDGKTYSEEQISYQWTAKNGKTFDAASPFVTASLKTYTRTHKTTLFINRYWYVNDRNSADVSSSATTAKNARKNFTAAKEFHDDGATGKNITADDFYYVAAVYVAVKPLTTGKEQYTYKVGNEVIATGIGSAAAAPVKLYERTAKEVPDHVHSYTGRTVVLPACETTGLDRYTCSCGDSYDVTTNALGHAYTSETTEATCDLPGYTTHTCTRCGAYYTDAPVDALGHDFQAGKVVAPTVKSEGYTVYTCTRCPASEKRDIVPALTGGSFTVASMNVDGLPNKILGITLNGDGPGASGSKAIGQAIAARNWDFFAVSEDFNYHSDLMSALPGYSAGTYGGKVSWLTNKTDGLNLIWKNGITVKGEKRTAWTSNYSTGIFGTGNGADTMINKGFRYYAVTVAEDVTVDVYILHMDADSDQGDINAREAQLKQLAAAIKASNNHNPIIVMGDTNCRYTREHLQTIFIDGLNADKRFTVVDPWVEKAWGGQYPAYGTDSIMAVDKGGPFPYPQAEIVDKMFVINNTDSAISITAESYTVDTSFVAANGQPLADHWPIVVNFSYSAR